MAKIKEEAKAIRMLAYDFLRLGTLGETGEKVLKEKGYSSYAKKAFIKKHSLGHDYFVQLKNRKDFKGEYFGQVTLKKAEYLDVLIDVLIKKDPFKAIQVLFPDQIGEILSVRKLNVSNNNDDDKDFRNEIFGIRKTTIENDK